MMRVERAEIGFTKVCDSVSNRLVVPYQANLLVECETEAPNSLSKAAAHQRIQAIGSDDQVVTAELVDRLDDACRIAA